jgi:hypothetical protein
LPHIGQVIDDAKEHHVVGECGGQSTYSPSKKGLSQMHQKEYKRMVVEA